MAVCLPYYSPFKSASQALTPHHRQTGLRLFIHSQRKIQRVTSPGARLRITAHQQQLLLTAFGRRRCNAGKKKKKKKTRISYCSDPWRDNLWSEWRREMREESLCHCLFFFFFFFFSPQVYRSPSSWRGPSGSCTTTMRSKKGFCDVKILLRHSANSRHDKSTRAKWSCLALKRWMSINNLL